MRHKTNFGLVLLSVFIMTALPIFADSDSSQNTSPSSKSGDAVLQIKSDKPIIKRSPSKNVLEIIYSDNMLSLTSNYYEGEFTIRFESYETGETVTVPSIFVGDICDIDLDCGEYTVSAERSDGLSFSGYLEISY